MNINRDRVEKDLTSSIWKHERIVGSPLNSFREKELDVIFRCVHIMQNDEAPPGIEPARGIVITRSKSNPSRFEFNQFAWVARKPTLRIRDKLKEIRKLALTACQNFLQLILMYFINFTPPKYMVIFIKYFRFNTFTTSQIFYFLLFVNNYCLIIGSL